MKPTQDCLYVKTATREDLMSECLNLQSWHAAEREALRLVKEKATKFRRERDAALAELERMQKARSALELELQEHEKSCKNMHILTRTLHYELLIVRQIWVKPKLSATRYSLCWRTKLLKQWYLISHLLRLCTLLESIELRKKQQWRSQVTPG